MGPSGRSFPGPTRNLTSYKHRSRWDWNLIFSAGLTFFTSMHVAIAHGLESWMQMDREWYYSTVQSTVQCSAVVRHSTGKKVPSQETKHKPAAPSNGRLLLLVVNWFWQFDSVQHTLFGPSPSPFTPLASSTYWNHRFFAFIISNAQLQSSWEKENLKVDVWRSQRRSSTT